MKTVTVDEARENLSELLRLVGSGKRVVITDGGKWVAALTPPPAPPPTPEELAAAEAARQAEFRNFVRMVVENHERDGNPLPADDPLRRLLAEEGAP
jgi:prevent-host-death family protein